MKERKAEEMSDLGWKIKVMYVTDNGEIPDYLIVTKRQAKEYLKKILKDVGREEEAKALTTANMEMIVGNIHEMDKEHNYYYMIKGRTFTVVIEYAKMNKLVMVGDMLLEVIE